MKPLLSSLGACALISALMFAGVAWAADATPTAQQSSPLAGTWVLEAADTLRADGTKVQGYGSNPQGRLMIDQDGRYSLQIYRSDSIKFAASDKGRGTPEEYKAAVMRMSTHIGRVTLDPSNGTIIFNIDHASFPNWEGTTQVRQYRWTGDKLSYQVPTSASGDGTTPVSEWRRQSSSMP